MFFKLQFFETQYIGALDKTSFDRAPKIEPYAIKNFEECVVCFTETYRQFLCSDATELTINGGEFNSETHSKISESLQDVNEQCTPNKEKLLQFFLEREISYNDDALREILSNNEENESCAFDLTPEKLAQLVPLFSYASLENKNVKVVYNLKDYRAPDKRTAHFMHSDKHIYVEKIHTPMERPALSLLYKKGQPRYASEYDHLDDKIKEQIKRFKTTSTQITIEKPVLHINNDKNNDQELTLCFYKNDRSDVPIADIELKYPVSKK